MQLSNEELLTTYSAEYMPTTVPTWISYTVNRPLFTVAHVREMLTDPRVQFGLWLLKGPILTARPLCTVVCSNERARQYLISNINRFWLVAAGRALRAIEWGASAHEVEYRRKQDGFVHFHALRDFDRNDIEVFSLHGRFCGLKIRSQHQHVPPYLGWPKAFLHVHNREANPFYGRSRLHAVYIPWWEKWGHGGYRDVRRLWYFKCAYNGGVIFYPPGSTKNEQGIVVPNREIAQEIIEKLRAGGVLALPAQLGNVGQGQGAPSWDYKPPEAAASPTGLLEYGTFLDNEILEALGIPPEVVQSGGDQGFGSSTGRQIPQTAFYATLQELAQWLLHDLDEQILRFLVRWNFGAIDYDIVPHLLDPSAARGASDSFNGNQFQDENMNADNGSPSDTDMSGGEDFLKAA